MRGRQRGAPTTPDEATLVAEMQMLPRLMPAVESAYTSAIHPQQPSWTHFSFCLFAGPVSRDGNRLRARQAVAIEQGKIDRSPTGTAVSARMALLHAEGEMTDTAVYAAVSIIASCFEGLIAGTTQVGDMAAIRPEISGRAWITGSHQHMLDPDDPWPEGYRLTDTWGIPSKDE